MGVRKRSCRRINTWLTSRGAAIHPLLSSFRFLEVAPVVPESGIVRAVTSGVCLEGAPDHGELGLGAASTC